VAEKVGFEKVLDYNEVAGEIDRALVHGFNPQLKLDVCGTIPAHAVRWHSLVLLRRVGGFRPISTSCVR